MQIPDVLDLLQHHFTVAELIPGVLGHSEVVLLAFFLLLLFFYHMVVGLKAELGRFLHWFHCTAAQTVVLAKRLQRWRMGHCWSWYCHQKEHVLNRGFSWNLPMSGVLSNNLDSSWLKESSDLQSLSWLQLLVHEVLAIANRSASCKHCAPFGHAGVSCLSCSWLWISQQRQLSSVGPVSMCKVSYFPAPPRCPRGPAGPWCGILTHAVCYSVLFPFVLQRFGEEGGWGGNFASLWSNLTFDD